MADVLNALSAKLTTSELRRINLRVARGDGIEPVAAEWLTAQALLPGA